jgi:hypothetical protein
LQTEVDFVEDRGAVTLDGVRLLIDASGVGDDGGAVTLDGFSLFV